MDTSAIFCIIEAIFLIAAYLIGKFVTNNPKITPETIESVTSKICLITDYAEAFIIWAKQFMSKSTGAEKMDTVVEKLKAISDKYDLNLSEDEIRAIAQRTYDTIKRSEQI